MVTRAKKPTSGKGPPRESVDGIPVSVSNRQMRERRTGNSMAGSGPSCNVRTGRPAKGCGLRGGRPSETVGNDGVERERKSPK